ncbi:MAG: prepilin-type N-terminal cleavage/methylation domain-containing protein [Pseudomonadota bacterium]
MTDRKILKNHKGFTLIEIIAVLVILGILAAVAVPKYLDLQTEAKIKAAQGQVAEIKGSLSAAWGKLMLQNNGTAPTISEVITAVGFTVSGTGYSAGVTPDIWYFTISNAGAIAVTARGADSGYAATGTWNLPQ